MTNPLRISSFAPIVNNDSKILILGTMPSVKSLEYQEYYGNKQNVFWQIMFAIFEEQFSTNYKVRKALLHKYQIAVWDVLSSCEREGSLDSNIKLETPNDIRGLLVSFPNIKCIVFSSQKAEQYFKKYHGDISGITYMTMPSPSGANARMSVKEKIENWTRIKELL